MTDLNSPGSCGFPHASVASTSTDRSRYPTASAGPRNGNGQKCDSDDVSVWWGGAKHGPETFRVNEISLRENLAAGRRRDGRRPQNRAQLTADEIKEDGEQTADYLARPHVDIASRRAGRRRA